MLIVNLFIETFKDIPLLDCLGLQYPRRGCSFDIGIRIPKFVKIILYSLADYNLLFLVVWITGAVAPEYVMQGENLFPASSIELYMTGLAASMIVNSLVTGLIVFRIFKVFREVRAAPDEPTSGTAGGSGLRTVIFVLIESGMALVSIQLVRLIATAQSVAAAELDGTAVKVVYLVVYIHEMLNVTIRSHISKSLSFY